MLTHVMFTYKIYSISFKNIMKIFFNWIQLSALSFQYEASKYSKIPKYNG